MTGYSYADLLPDDYAERALRADVLAGLCGPGAKTMPPTWLYDKVGSELFEEITRLPEYYPTRAEREILTTRAAEAVALAGCDTLVELGSGSSLKTELLLDALVGRSDRAPGERESYVALDVSEDALRGACARIVSRYPAISVHAVRADFTTQVSLPPNRNRRLVAFLGGTIGNFEPAARARFLAAVRDRLAPGDHLLLGADLVKAADILVPAYDDAAGVTAAFDLNLLDVLNAAFDGDFRRDDFRHRAVWDVEQEWIEMRLRAKRAHTVTLAALGHQVSFAAGEEIRTEVSAKFRQEGLERELRAAGFARRAWWTDRAGQFSLSLWAVAA